MIDSLLFLFLPPPVTKSKTGTGHPKTSRQGPTFQERTAARGKHTAVPNGSPPTRHGLDFARRPEQKLGTLLPAAPGSIVDPVWKPLPVGRGPFRARSAGQKAYSLASSSRARLKPV